MRDVGILGPMFQVRNKKSCRLVLVTALNEKKKLF